MSRLMLRTGVLLLTATIGVTLRAQSDVKSLQGIQALGVVAGNITQDVEEAGLHRSDIQTDVELKLGQAGIKVVPTEESRKQPGSPYLLIQAMVKLAGGSGNTIAGVALSVELIQAVHLTRDPSILLPAPTWSFRSEAIGDVRAIAQIRELIKNEVDTFIKAYLSANPKK